MSEHCIESEYQNHHTSMKLLLHSVHVWIFNSITSYGHPIPVMPYINKQLQFAPNAYHIHCFLHESHQYLCLMNFLQKNPLHR